MDDMPNIAISPRLSGSATEVPDQTSPSSPGIPWAAVGQWSAVNEALAFFTKSHGQRLGSVFRLAAATDAALRALHDMTAALALSSCRFCPAPCCDGAAPWYDLADLLMIHFGGIAIPPGQPIARYGDGCRFLGPAGCRLPRPQRPWICVWYTCPVQRAALSLTPDRHREYISLTATIKTHRQRMERLFIGITTGDASSVG